jgi:hypothetical protein
MATDSSLAEIVSALYAVQFCKEIGFMFCFKGMPANIVVKEINSAPIFYLKSANSLKLSIYDELQNFKLAKFFYT